MNRIHHLEVWTLQVKKQSFRNIHHSCSCALSGNEFLLSSHTLRSGISYDSSVTLQICAKWSWCCKFLFQTRVVQLASKCKRVCTRSLTQSPTAHRAVMVQSLWASSGRQPQAHQHTCLSSHPTPNTPSLFGGQFKLQNFPSEPLTCQCCPASPPAGSSPRICTE